MLPLDIVREQNALTYWARSSRLKDTLPINEATTEDPIYLFKLKRNKNFSPPYSQRVLKLIEKYNLVGVPIHDPCYADLSNIESPSIDLGLVSKIKKSDNPGASLINASLHIARHYGDFYHIFTDGSKDADKLKAGAGIVVYSPENKIIHTMSIKLNGYLSIYTCELIAIQYATSYIAQNNIKKAVIFSDSLSSLQSLQVGHSKTRPELINEILQNNTEIHKNNGTVHFTWVPSHVGLQGNEDADKLAKLGCTSGTEHPIKLSVKEVYSLIKMRISEHWSHIWDQYCNKQNIDINRSKPSKMIQYHSDRNMDCQYTRLKLNVSYLKGHKFTGDKNCQNCNTPETAHHFFFECNAYVYQRQEMESSLLKLGLNNIKLNTLLDPPATHANTIRNIVYRYIQETGYKNKL